MEFIDHAPTDADFTLMRQRLLAQLPGRRKTAWRRRALFAGGGLALTAVLAAATFIFLSDQERNRTATCYAEDSLSSESIPVNVITDEENPDRVQLALESCTAAWERDLVREGSSDPNNEPIHPVPPLTVCVSTMDTLWVFPTEESAVCERLGAHPPE